MDKCPDKGATCLFCYRLQFCGQSYLADLKREIFPGMTLTEIDTEIPYSVFLDRCANYFRQHPGQVGIIVGDRIFTGDE